MKRLILLSITLLMLCQGTASVWIMAAFYANRDYIVKNLCENRNFAESPCKGQCVLMKKLQKEQEREQKQSDLKLTQVQLFVDDHKLSISPITGFERFLAAPLYLAPDYHYGAEMSIFHPPLRSYS